MLAAEPFVPVHVPAVVPVQWRVAHSMPGRVRLVHDAAESEYGLTLARRFAAHRHVKSVRLVVAAHSLTVHFDANVQFGDILEGLPAEGTLPAPITLVKSRRPRLLSMVSLAADLIGGNPLGIALAMVGPLFGESTLIS